MIITETRSVIFPSLKENVTLVEKFIDEICQFYNIGDENYGNILVAVTEAVSNAIFHGNRLNPDKSVRFFYETKANNLCFTVEDEGNGYNPDTLPDPTDPSNLEVPNGRGVFLMRKLTDDIKFLNDGRRVELYFRIANQ
ncbi:MAG TPA: ATP-binding protein [Chryseolinea sp.]|jgi:serine/threonine-protein kinase RsbW|nr:ATP-binding protein [Chryseolinea sp.]HPH82739.1 ATP-binding protein [Flavobacteriales bacterium]